MGSLLWEHKASLRWIITVSESTLVVQDSTTLRFFESSAGGKYDQIQEVKERYSAIEFKNGRC